MTEETGSALQRISLRRRTQRDLLRKKINPASNRTPIAVLITWVRMDRPCMARLTKHSRLLATSRTSPNLA